MLPRALRMPLAFSLALGTLLMGPVAQAHPAEAAQPLLSCPVGEHTSHYEPGLTYSKPRPLAVKTDGRASACADLSGHHISSVRYTGELHGTGNCLALQVRGPSVYQWSNGETSTVEGTLGINPQPNGQAVAVAKGTVTAGPFTGSTVVRTWTLLNTDMAACLTPEGLTSTHGLSTLTVTP